MPVPGVSGFEGIAQKVELDVLVVLSSMVIPALHDSRLVGMRRQFASPQACLHRRFDLQRLLLARTMDYYIIRIPLERAAGILPADPCVEHVMEEDVRQQRRRASTHAAHHAASPAWSAAVGQRPMLCSLLTIAA